MRRADRLYALVEELRIRSPRPVSRARLAESLEVALRTVERDVCALQQAGVPIWSERGLRGGYVLDPHWSAPPPRFDAAEALAVLMSLAGSQRLPFTDARRRAEHKMLAAMTTPESAQVQHLSTRVRLEISGALIAPAIRRLVEQAVLERRVASIVYLGRDGRTTSRVIEAQGLHLTANAAYLVAWCRQREAARSFRLDRILSVRLFDELAPERDIDRLLDWVDGAVAPGVDQATGSVVKPKRRRNWGPPRKSQDVTGSNPDFAKAITAALPGVEQKQKRQRLDFRAGSQLFLTLEDEFAVLYPEGAETLHLVLREIPRDEVRRLIEETWASQAPKRNVTAYLRRRETWAKQPHITEDDIRRIVLGLPGANEGPIWGNDPGFRIGDIKKTRFARFGPPEGSRIGNLLPPDDEHALLIFKCQQRPALLAAAPDRFFTTPHYGDPDEPGALIVRLSELRGKGDLAEIAELLEDSWRAAASPDDIAELDRAQKRTPHE